MLKSLFVSVVILSNLFTVHSTAINWKANTKKYGEPCVNDDECIDFRMICHPAEAICECDRFHNWEKINHNTFSCVTSLNNLKKYLAEEEGIKPDRGEKLSDEAHSLFVYFGIWGIIIISLGILLSIGCVAFVLL